MGIVFKNDVAVDKYIDDFISTLSYMPSALYIIMRCGYTEKEMNNKCYCIESLVYDGDIDGYAWNNDWYEGQHFIEIARIITDDDVLTAFGYN